MERAELGRACGDIPVLDSSQERPLALVVERPPHNISVVLVDRTLGVAGRGNIFDDDDVARVLAIGLLALSSRDGRLVEQAIGINHVVDDAVLGIILGLGLGFGGKVVSIVVTKVIVGDGERLYASVHQGHREDGLELGLAQLEIVASNEGAVAPQAPRHKEQRYSEGLR